MLTQGATLVALSFLEHLVQSEQTRQSLYGKYRDYYSGDHPVQLTTRQKKYLQLADNVTFCDNCCEVVVDALAERLKVSGFDTKNTQMKDLMAQWWAMNRMDLIQCDVHKCAVRDGDTYVMVDWDPELKMPRFTPHEASDGSSGIHVVYEDGGRKIARASKRWLVIEGPGTGRVRRLNVYYPDRIEKYVSDSETGSDDWQQYHDEEGEWPIPWLDPEGIPLGVPIVHFRNKPAGNEYGISELASVLPLQDALNKFLIDYLAAADTTGFQMIWATGFDASGMSVAPGQILWTTAKDAKIGVLTPADMSSLKDGIQLLTGEIAHVSRTPPYFFRQAGGSQESGEALKMQDAPLVGKATDRATAFGNSYEDMMTLGVRLEGTFGSARMDPEIVSCEWEDPETRNEEAHYRTLEAKQRLGIPMEKIWLEMGYTAEEIERLKAMRQEEEERKASLGAALLESFEKQGGRADE